MIIESASPEPASPDHHSTTRTGAATVEPATAGPVASTRTGAAIAEPTAGPVAGGAGRRARRVRGLVVAAVVAGLVGAALTGWMGAARAATTDRLHSLNEQLDQRVTATRTTSDRLGTTIVVARNIRSASPDASPESLATLDAAIRSAQEVVDQRVTSREPVSVPQARMLVDQASAMEQSLSLVTADLRTAVDRVRVSRNEGRPAGFGVTQVRSVVVQP